MTAEGDDMRALLRESRRVAKAVETALERRIGEVLERKVFPDAKAWCLAAGVSHNYIGTLKSRLRKGQVTQGKSHQIQSLARAAGVSVEWLMGMTDNPSSDEDPLFDDFLKAIHLRPGLSEVLDANPRRWHVTTVLRAMQLRLQGTADGPNVSWLDLLDGVERGRYEATTGDGRTVHNANVIQIGPRPPLPPKR